VHGSPYEEGWLARLQPSAWEAESSALLQGPAVVAAMAHHAWLHRVAE
jgi:glycine cleavage system H lipoate-binding protein